MGIKWVSRFQKLLFIILVSAGVDFFLGSFLKTNPS